MLNRDRLQQAQARMRERGIDAYLILTHDDYIYFFGEDRFQPAPSFPPPGRPSSSLSKAKRPRSESPSAWTT